MKPEHLPYNQHVEEFDVLIVGAGISGIGTACHLQRECPGIRYAILEGRERMGGTWDLFRYPGIRSDSDMHTMGYSFKPWVEAKAIADGPSILSYVKDAAAENNVEEHIRFSHRVESAAWSSRDARWTVEVQRPEGRRSHFRCNMFLLCSGYFDYENPYTPEFDGIEDYDGPVIHPQLWPENLDYHDKRLVVIGSGATAMTLVPSLAAEASHVTMLQRSPTYVVSRPAQDAVSNWLRRLLPDRIAYAITRAKNVRLQRRFYNLTRTAPERVKRKLLRLVKAELGDDYVDTHFTPRYKPWDERLCLLPDGDLFEAIRAGRASVVTDTIERFNRQGIELRSGETLEADIIVTATGLNLRLLGDAKFSIDGEPVDFAQRYSYKGMMYSGIPNLINTFGYINASWTLRADLTAEYACRVINHMKSIGASSCTPTLREEDADMPARDWIEDFRPGYMRRLMHRFPKQGDREPWLNTQNFMRDKKMTRSAPIDDGTLSFG